MSDDNSDGRPPAEPLASPFRVGEWVAEPAWNRLQRNDETVKVEPRVMRLLATLAAAPGRPLTRQELLDSVWPDVLVNEEALSRAVSQLRRALGDDARKPAYVETVHKGGYCLVAKVGEPTAIPVADSPEAAAADPVSRRPARLLLLTIAALAAVFLLYVALVLLQKPQPALALRPLTSDPGREIDPAVSPDGRQVAYLASGGQGYDLFVRDIEAGSLLRLTRDSVAKGHPAWSPDGRRIAYVGSSGGTVAIFLVPAAGGAISKVIDLPSWSYGLDWSPDGRTLAYSDAAAGKPPAIVLLDVASKAARPVTTADGTAGDVKPAFSPDGKRLAFIRNDVAERQQIAVADIGSGGNLTLVTPPSRQLRGFDWSPDGTSVIYSSRAARRFGLWRVRADGRSAPEPIPVEGGELFNPSISRKGRLVVEDVQQDRDVWQVPLGGGSAAPLIRSTFDDYDAVYAPDGSQLAFVSERSGMSAVWISSHNRQPRLLSSAGGAEISHLSWARNSSAVTYLAGDGGRAAIHVQALAGAEPERLLSAHRGQVPLGWTSGGEALLLITPRGREWRIERFTRASGKSRSIEAPATLLAAVAADGRSVFGLASDGEKVLHIGLDGGVMRQFRLPASLTSLVALLPARDSLYLVQDQLDRTSVHRLDFGSGSVSKVATIDFFGGGTPAVAPDGRTLVFTRAQETANDLAWIQL